MEILAFLKNNLRNSLVKDVSETTTALEKVLSQKSKRFHDLILLKARHEEVRNKLIKGTISDTEHQVEMNRLRESLLHFINDLQSSDLKGEENAKEKNNQQSQSAKETVHSDRVKKGGDPQNKKTQNDFSARVVSKEKSGKYLSIAVNLQHEKHQIEYVEDGLSPKLLVDGVEVGRKGASANAANILLSGFTLGLIKEKGGYKFYLSDHDKNYPASLKLAFGMSRNFTGIRLTVQGISLVDEGQV